MAALNPANRVPSGLVPYYRRYDLPWAPSEETEKRFRVILRNLAIVFAIVAVIMPFLPRTERVTNTDSLPERVGQWVRAPPPPHTAPAGGSARQGLQERLAGKSRRSGSAARPN